MYEWSQDCINWCYDEVSLDKFADQKYLDKWQKNYNKVFVVKDFLVNIGPWNFYTLDSKNINKIICYHFHNLYIFKEKLFITNVSSFSKLNMKKRNLIKQIYIPYVKNLELLESKLQLENPDKIRSQDFLSKFFKLLKLFIVIKNLDFFVLK